MRKVLGGILIVCMLITGYPMVAEASIENLYAQSAVLMDADSGRVLFEKNGGEKRPMASTTKIMTCILTLENANMDEVAEASSEAASQPKVRLGVRSGETYYIKDLLYALMLESFNDAAVVIAEHVGGSLSGFAQMMNNKAKEIGCEDAYFITPNGLDAEDENGIHSITAADLASIMRYCITISPKKEEFLEITRTMSYAFSDIQGSRSFSCVNHNAFLGMMDGALTGKTGFTGNAGYCYVGALKRDGKTFIVALLACGWPNNKSYKWSDTKQLMEYGLANYEYRNVWEDMEFEKLPVKDGIPDNKNIHEMALTEIGIKKKREINLLLAADEKITVDVIKEKELKAPVQKNQVVGNVRYLLGDELICEVPIVTKSSIEKISFSWCADQIIERFLGGN